MEKFKRFVDIDYSQFEGDDLEALYGLPKKIQFCKKCVISNQRPNSCEEYKNGNLQRRPFILMMLACVMHAEWQSRSRRLIGKNARKN